MRVSSLRLARDFGGMQHGEGPLVHRLPTSPLRAGVMTSETPSRKIFLRLRRRQALASLALALGAPGLAYGQARSEREEDEDLRNLRLLDLSEGGRRFVLILPRYQQPEDKIPVVVFLHGLGET